MHTPRFQLPFPDESPDSLKNQTLILKCLQDPLHVVIKNPTDFEQEMLLRPVGAQLPASTLGMIIESIRNNTPLDRGALSHVAEVSKVKIEDATSLVWSKGIPEVTRYVVISSLVPEGDDPHSENSHHFSSDRFQLTIDKLPSGDIEVALGWENGDCAESLDALNQRWRKMDAVYHSLKRPTLPWDLLSTATERAKESHDDEYIFEGLTMVAYPMSPDVILQDLEGTQQNKHESARENSQEHDEDEDDDNDDPFGLFNGVHTGEAPDPDDEPEDDAVDTRESAETTAESELAMPGDDLTILDPTPGQLTAIAKLSGMPISKDLVQRLMMTTYEGAQLTPMRFESVPAKTKEKICVHSRTTYILNRTFSDSRRYSIDECDLNKPTMFTIDLSREKATSPGRAEILKSVLHWEHFTSDCEVKNWDRIVEIARKPT
jgi:hypothetical protein